MRLRLLGRGADGQFRTAPAKVYPPAMCRALGFALAEGLAPFANGEAGRADLGEWAALHTSLEQALPAQWRPDFAG